MALPGTRQRQTVFARLLSCSRTAPPYYFHQLYLLGWAHFVRLRLYRGCSSSFAKNRPNSLSRRHCSQCRERVFSVFFSFPLMLGKASADCLLSAERRCVRKREKKWRKEKSGVASGLSLTDYRWSTRRLIKEPSRKRKRRRRLDQSSGGQPESTSLGSFSFSPGPG